MTSLPTISIITVVFNGGETIEKTVRSVLGQDYPNKEYIIIDGNSTDNTVDIIRNYEKDLSYWVSEPDNGLYDAMNKGLKEAKGEIVGIINADDFYMDNVFTLVADIYKESPDLDVLYGDMKYVNARGHSEILHPEKNLSITSFSNMPILHPSSFVRRKLYDKLGRFDTDYKIIADLEFMLRAFKHNATFEYVNEVFATMNAGGESESGLMRAVYEYEELASRYSLPLAVHVRFRLRKIRSKLLTLLRSGRWSSHLLEHYLGWRDEERMI